MKMRCLSAFLAAVASVLASASWLPAMAQTIQPQTWSQFLASAPPVSPLDAYLMPFVLPGGSGVITGRATVGQLGPYIINTYGTALQPKALSNGYLWVGNQSNLAAAVPMSGDCSIVYTGALTCLKTNGVPFTAAATTPLGISGASLCLLSANCTFSGTDNFTGTFKIGGTAVTLPVPVAIGGTGAATAWQARNALCPLRSIPSGTSDTATTADCVVVWNSATASAKAQAIPACTSENGGFDITIVDGIGSASGIIPITITPVSGTVLLGASAQINANFSWLHARCDGSTTNYVEIG